MQLVIVTHGHLATSLLESARMILGALPAGVWDICLSPEDSLESAHHKIVSVLERAGPAAGSLVLVDLFGGTASNAAAWALEGRDSAVVAEDSAVVAGVNLPMLLEVLVNMDRLSAAEAAQLAVEAGLGGVVDVRAALFGEDAPPVVGLEGPD